MRKQSWDTETARAMYDAGKSDREIAEALGISRNTVYHWQFVQNLPSNTRKRPKEAEPKAVPPRPPALPPDGDPAGAQRSGSGGERRREWSGRSPRQRRGQSGAEFLPAKGPVELSVGLNGHAFALRAPYLEGAERIYE